MTTLFKTEAEKEQHVHSIIDVRRSISKTGSMTRKCIGSASRRETDAMGVLSATIPGNKTVDYMISYAKKHGLSTPTWTPSKTGKRMGATISW